MKGLAWLYDFLLPQAGIGRPQLQNADTAEGYPLLQRLCLPHVTTEQQTSEFLRAQQDSEPK